MNSDQWQRVKSLFEQALDLPEDARDAFLDQSQEPASIVAEVRKLIALDGQAGDFLDAKGSGDDPEDQLPAGYVIGGKFRIVSLLGQGGMGVVYRAEDLVLSRPVALKFLPGGPAGADQGPRLMREARAAAALNHANICVVHETGEHQGRPFIVMELLEGQALNHRIAAGALETGQLLDWAVQIVLGLEAAHQAGIVHRDIKPGNIFITTRGQVKILDFGIAKIARSRARTANATSAPADSVLTAAAAVIGTLPYMSPEQACGEALDARTDLFSFGAVLYEMATGKPAFEGASTSAVHRAVLNFTPPPASTVNTSIPASLDAVIGKAMEKDRELRYQRAGDLLADLKRLQEVPAPQQKAVNRTLPRKGWWLAAALAATLLTSGAAWIWLHRTPRGDHHEVVLADFDNSTGDTEFDHALDTLLAIDLKQSPYLAVASESKTNTALRLMERKPGEKLTPALAREVCQRINDQAVLSAKLARFGQQYLITLTATDCASGEDLVESKAVAGNRDGLLKAVESVAADVRKRLGEPLQSVERFNKTLLVKETGSLDALKAYTQAHDLGASGDYQGSIPLFARAIELDPKFAIAYGDLCVIYSNLGESDLAAANCRKAYELRDLSTEPDRLFIVATYHNHVTGDLHESIRNYETWSQTYPRDTAPLANLANIQTQIGRPDLAIAPAIQARGLDPKNYIAYVILARAQMRAGQTNQALDTCRQAIALGLDGAEIRGLLAQLAFVRHDGTALAEQVAWARGKSAEPYLTLQEMLADFAQGKRRAALEALRQLVDGYRKQGMPERANRMEGGLPRIEAELGLMDDARSLLSQLQAGKGSTDVPVAFAEVGDVAQAEKMLRRELDEHPDDTLWQGSSGPQIRAAIALSRRKPEEAIEALRPGLPYDLRSFELPTLRGRAYLAAGKPDLAAIEFHKVTDHPYADPLSHDLPLAHLGLARACAMRGDTAAARDEYEKFNALWKDADQDLPVWKEARQEYARLGR